MLSDDLIKSFKDDPNFTELQEYILSKIDELDSVSGLDGLSNEEAGEEVRVRGRAKLKLQEILAPFLDYNERREPTPDEIQKVKSKVGL